MRASSTSLRPTSRWGGIEAALALGGINRKDFADQNAFNAALQAIHCDSDIEDSYIANQQIAFVGGDVKISDVSFFKSTLVPLFKIHYRVQTAKANMETVKDAVRDRLNQMFAEKDASREVINLVQYDFEKQIDDLDELLRAEISVGAGGIEDLEERYSQKAIELDGPKIVEKWRLEAVRRQWFAANLEKITARATVGFAEAFDERLHEDRALKGVSSRLRTELQDFIKERLLDTVMKEGGKSDWDNALKGILQQEDGVALSETERKLISAELNDRIEKCAREFQVEKEKNLAERKIEQDIADVDIAFCRSLLTDYESGFRDAKRKDEYLGLVGVNPDFVEPANVFLAFERKCQKLASIADEQVRKTVMKSVSKKKAIPDLNKLRVLMDELKKARAACLDGLRKAKTEAASPDKNQGKGYYDRDPNAVQKDSADMLAFVKAAFAKAKVDTGLFTDMLNHMRHPAWWAELDALKV